MLCSLFVVADNQKTCEPVVDLWPRSIGRMRVVPVGARTVLDNKFVDKGLSWHNSVAGMTVQHMQPMPVNDSGFVQVVGEAHA